MEDVPENIQGLRRGASMLIVLSILISFKEPYIGIGGIIAGVLWLLASKPATITSQKSYQEGSRFWLAITYLLSVVAFVLGVAVLSVLAGGGH
jgi:hypothetical protein